MKRLMILALYLVLVLMLISFQPADRPLRAQAATPGLIDALGAQATANAVATQAAYQQQQSAANLQAQAAALQAQAAAAQAQAAAQVAQATAIAQQQQAQVVAQQATVDAAILQATVIAQETRTAMEIGAQQTREALAVEATRTRTAQEVQAAQSAWEATRAAVAMQATAERRDAIAVATMVYGSLEATQVSQASALAQQAGLSSVFIGAIGVIGLAVVIAALLLLARWFRRQWWQLGRLQPFQPAAGGSGTAASLTTIDAETSEFIRRVGPIDLTHDGHLTAEMERAFHATY